MDAFPEPPLIAEDPYSIAALVNPARWSDVAATIDQMQVSFGNWAVGHAPEKRWDLYLVVLVAADISPDEVGPVEQVVSDIRFVRKIVRGAVLPTTESVEHALAPFLPVSPLGVRDITDPMRDLEQDLRAQGIDPTLVSSAIDTFGATGQVVLP
jgi:hypothetical protein